MQIKSGRPTELEKMIIYWVAFERITQWKIIFLRKIGVFIGKHPNNIADIIRKLVIRPENAPTK